MEDNKELEGLPSSLGTKKCIYCKTEPESEAFWEVFIDYYGEDVSAPCCNECILEHSKGGTGEAPE